jgi:hypothetical protein
MKSIKLFKQNQDYIQDSYSSMLLNRLSLKRETLNKTTDQHISEDHLHKEEKVPVESVAPKNFSVA